MMKTSVRTKPRHSLATKQGAFELRKAGRTHREIAKELGISLGSADLWTKGIILSDEQKQAILKRRNCHKFTPAEREITLRRLRKNYLERRQSDEFLIEKIRNFYKEHGRIPLKREFNALRIFRERFGSWNNAIRIAGFDPNPVLFSKKFISKDGHNCDSFAEKIIDDWLSDHEIPHSRNFRYENTKMTADFLIEPNIVVEFFGLAGVQKKYDEIIETKRLLCGKLNLNLLEIYPPDIFPNNQLVKLFSELLKKT